MRHCVLERVVLPAALLAMTSTGGCTTGPLITDDGGDAGAERELVLRTIEEVHPAAPGHAAGALEGDEIQVTAGTRAPRDTRGPRARVFDEMRHGAHLSTLARVVAAHQEDDAVHLEVATLAGDSLSEVRYVRGAFCMHPDREPAVGDVVWLSHRAVGSTSWLSPRAGGAVSPSLRALPRGAGDWVVHTPWGDELWSELWSDAIDALPLVANDERSAVEGGVR